MALHAPSVHFHLGALLLTTLATCIAFLISALSRIGLLKDDRLSPERKEKLMGHLDFTAGAAGVLGFLGILGSMIAGLIDSSTYSDPSKYTTDYKMENPLDALSKGLDFALDNDILYFKMIWGTIGALCFLLMAILRFYYAKIQKEQFYDQHLAIQALYAEVAILGYFILTIVGGTGGFFAKGETVLQEYAITEGFLPKAIDGGGDFLLYVTILAVIVGIILAAFAIYQKRASQG
ncbi:MAG: hypothetical protein ACFFB3_12730 [Candidatus Hodarchaeota archaeon]